MKKFPLNQKGIQELQQELHALSNPKLLLEIRALKLDLPDWIKSKFNVSTEQLECMHQWSENFRNYISVKCGIALAKRIVINFTIFDFKNSNLTVPNPYYQATISDTKQRSFK